MTVDTNLGLFLVHFAVLHQTLDLCILRTTNHDDGEADVSQKFSLVHGGCINENQFFAGEIKMQNLSEHLQYNYKA